MLTETILKKGTLVYLSEIGYYNYSYVNINASFVLDKDQNVKELSTFKSGRPKEEKWKAYLMHPDQLKDQKNRPSNVIWTKGEINESS